MIDRQLKHALQSLANNVYQSELQYRAALHNNASFSWKLAEERAAGRRIAALNSRVLALSLLSSNGDPDGNAVP